MLNKFLIPTALVATVVIAGIFAFMPVEKASTVHGNLATSTQLGQIDRGIFFTVNQTYISAAQTASGVILLPAQTGVTYTGQYVITAINDNATATGHTKTRAPNLECGLVDGNGQQISGTTAAGNATLPGTPTVSGTLSTANLGSGEAVRVQIDTNPYTAQDSFGGVCQVTIFLQSGSG